MLDRIKESAKESAFVEVDQKNTNAGWKNLLPPGPIPDFSMPYTLPGFPQAAGVPQ